MRKFVLIGALAVSIGLAQAFTSSAQDRARWAGRRMTRQLWVAQEKGFLAKQVCRPNLNAIPELTLWYHSVLYHWDLWSNS